jgi:hypothetical protein
MECHADNWDLEYALNPIEAEFGISQHNTGDTFVRRGSTSGPECSRCHTNEGFQIYIETGTEQAVSQSSRIGCFACHAPHTYGDFSLRKTGAADLTLGDSYDAGTSNTCAVCHQNRAPSPDFTSADPIRSPYWGPHHGPQASMVAGQGAYEFDGPYSGSSTHSAALEDGCVDCHMGPVADNGLGGGHSFWMRYEYHGHELINTKGCDGCHAPWGPEEDRGDRDEAATEDVEETKADFAAELTLVKAELIARGWLDDEDHVNTDSPPTAADDRGAVFNYLMLLEDRSGGIHNPTYANAVLNATKDYLGL